jgi:hypothetical protein
VQRSPWSGETLNVLRNRIAAIAASISHRSTLGQFHLICLAAALGVARGPLAEQAFSLAAPISETVEAQPPDPRRSLAFGGQRSSGQNSGRDRRLGKLVPIPGPSAISRGRDGPIPTDPVHGSPARHGPAMTRA